MGAFATGMIIGSTIYNPLAQPSGSGGRPQFYSTQDRCSELTAESGFNRILAGAARCDEAQVTSLAHELEDRLEKFGIESRGLFGAARQIPTNTFSSSRMHEGSWG